MTEKQELNNDQRHRTLDKIAEDLADMVSEEDSEGGVRWGVIYNKFYDYLQKLEDLK